MASSEKKYPCACEYQIVWFFEKPTICVCPQCERTHYHDVKVCPVCDHAICYFELSDDSHEDFYRDEEE